MVQLVRRSRRGVLSLAAALLLAGAAGPTVTAAADKV